MDSSEPEYHIYEWRLGDKYRAALQTLNPEAISSQSGPRTWYLKCPPGLMALAVAWKGARCGAWWDLHEIIQYLNMRQDIPLQDFSLLKWLRVPVLEPSLEASFHSAVQKCPMRFVKAWRDDEGLPEGLMRHDNVLGINSLIQHFLWCSFPRAYIKEATQELGQCPRRFEQGQCCRHLSVLGEISLDLIWHGIERCRRQCQGQWCALVSRYLRMQVGLIEDDGSQKLSYRLQKLRDEAAGATALPVKELEEIGIRYINVSKDTSIRLSDHERQRLLQIGATHKGRSFLFTKIARQQLDRL
jgi:hypothetical protein